MPTGCHDVWSFHPQQAHWAYQSALPFIAASAQPVEGNEELHHALMFFSCKGKSSSPNEPRSLELEPPAEVSNQLMLHPPPTMSQFGPRSSGTAQCCAHNALDVVDDCQVSVDGCEHI